MGREPDYPLESEAEIAVRASSGPAASRSPFHPSPTSTKADRTVSLSSLAPASTFDRRNAPRRHGRKPDPAGEVARELQPAVRAPWHRRVMVPMRSRATGSKRTAGAHAPRQSRRRRRHDALQGPQCSDAGPCGRFGSPRRRGERRPPQARRHLGRQHLRRCRTRRRGAGRWIRPAGLRVGLVGGGRRRQRHRFCARGSGCPLVERDGPERRPGLRASPRESRRAATPAEPAQPSTLRSSTSSSTPRPSAWGPDDGSPVDLVRLHARHAVVDIVTQPGHRPSRSRHARDAGPWEVPPWSPPRRRRSSNSRHRAEREPNHGSDKLGRRHETRSLWGRRSEKPASWMRTGARARSVEHDPRHRRRDAFVGKPRSPTRDRPRPPCPPSSRRACGSAFPSGASATSSASA